MALLWTAGQTAIGQTTAAEQGAVGRNAPTAQPAVAGQPPPVANTGTTVELTVVGGPDLNPNSQSRPSPVVVRLFDLSATASFKAADFETLFEHPGDTLKKDIAAQEELVLRPGDIQQRDHSLPPNVVAVGIAAGFRDLEKTVWHLAVPIKPGQRNFVLLALDNNKIRVENIDAGRSD
jgi:type VI secretion system protein VasD